MAKPPPARSKEDKAFRDLLGKLVRVPKEEVDEKKVQYREEQQKKRR
jgi:hypothetical protein